VNDVLHKQALAKKCPHYKNSYNNTHRKPSVKPPLPMIPDKFYLKVNSSTC